MPTRTYTPIKLTTLTTAAASVTLDLTGVTGYTDLEIKIDATVSSSVCNMAVRFNGDTATNYSVTGVYGNGSTATSSRHTNQTFGYMSETSATSRGTTLLSVFNYANTTTFKTFLNRGGTVDTASTTRVGLWRKTPEAITSITIVNDGGVNFTIGSTFAVYGIKAGS